jgi:hypothetical protein
VFKKATFYNILMTARPYSTFMVGFLAKKQLFYGFPGRIASASATCLHTHRWCGKYDPNNLGWCLSGVSCAERHRRHEYGKDMKI